VQAIGQEGNEDMRLDALLDLVIDRAQLQIVRSSAPAADD
jgi:hypothetical protein